MPHPSSTDDIISAFTSRYGRHPEIVVRAPGRVNLLGAHIDYSEGWVITGAIDRAVWLAASPSQVTRIEALDLEQTTNLDLENLPPPLPDRPGETASWIDYPAGVAWALAEAGIRPLAMEAVFGGDIPIGAGTSSSAAVEMAFLLAWEALTRHAGNPILNLDGADRALLGMRAENGYLGVKSGIMDQFSSLHGAPGHLIFLDCRSLDFEHLPLPNTTRILIADSGVRRKLAEFDYNDRRAECQQASEILRRELPEIRTLRDVTPDEFELYSHRLSMPLRRRARHAIAECQRTRAGAAALSRGDLQAFGQLMRQSHLSSRDLYEVSIPQLDVLAAAAWSAAGCYGARLVGAGFGGCVTVLAEASAVDTVEQAMVAAFQREFDRQPEIFTCAIADGASVELE